MISRGCKQNPAITTVAQVQYLIFVGFAGLLQVTCMPPELSWRKNVTPLPEAHQQRPGLGAFMVLRMLGLQCKESQKSAV
jgi:hypothetical protein